MAKPRLRVATSDDAPKRPKGLVEAAQNGTYRELLEAQKLDIAKSLADPLTQGPARAALHRQLGLIAKELRDIDEIEAEEVSSRGSAQDARFDASAV